MSPDNCLLSRHQPRDSLKSSLWAPLLSDTIFCGCCCIIILHVAMYANEWHCANIIIGQIDCKKTKKNLKHAYIFNKQKKPTVGVRCCDFMSFVQCLSKKGFIVLLLHWLCYLVVKQALETLQAQLITHAHHHWILKENLLLYSYDVISYDYLWKVKYKMKFNKIKK